jgi:phage FluMu gp28-like protein
VSLPSASVRARVLRKLDARAAKRRAEVNRLPLPATATELLSRQLTAAGSEADPWQRALLDDDSRRIVCLAARQTGKGSVAAARIVHDAARSAGALHLVVSASQRQAQIVIERCAQMAQFLGGKVKVDVTATEVRLGTSRIVALPSSSTSLRGWTVDGGDNPDVKGTLLLDEGCFMPEDAWNAVVPTTVATGARILITSSAGALGHWSQLLFDGSDESWSRYRVRADDVERYDLEFLDSERLRLPTDVFRAEYESQFRALVSGDPVFDPALLQRAFGAEDLDVPESRPAWFDLSAPIRELV